MNKATSTSSMKVFCIGFHKTGTTSLDKALQRLGYNVVGVRHELAQPLMQGDVQPAINLMKNYDAAQDNPWPLLYKELDTAYPGSKFILSIRDEQAWWESIRRHFAGKTTQLRTWIYGVGDPTGEEQRYRRRYRKHNEEVKRYFSGRKDLLIFHTGKDGWRELCQFLAKNEPSGPFPHANKGKTWLQRLRRFIRTNIYK